jgi:acetyl-CoA acetyltransferase
MSRAPWVLSKPSVGYSRDHETLHHHAGLAAVEQQWFGIGPMTAAETALHRAGIRWADLDVVELNEAFAVQALACLHLWPDLDPAIVNPNGGALALGHPLGVSGARIVTTLAWELYRRRARWGLAALCVGVGQGLALVLEADPMRGDGP